MLCTLALVSVSCENDDDATFMSNDIKPKSEEITPVDAEIQRGVVEVLHNYFAGLPEIPNKRVICDDRNYVYGVGASYIEEGGMVYLVTYKITYVLTADGGGHYMTYDEQVYIPWPFWHCDDLSVWFPI